MTDCVERGCESEAEYDVVLARVSDSVNLCGDCLTRHEQSGAVQDVQEVA